jgi:superfamily II DNA or RNA helicase
VKTELRPYQKEAVDAFLAAGKGILAIHSGAGKTVIAAAIAEALARKKFGVLGAEIPAGSGRSPFVTLVVVPTLDLIDQTMKVMDREGIPNVMVITYAKASRLENDEKFWESFDLLIFDEVHHLAQPGAWQRLLVPAFQSPYALGLSATPPTDPENILLRALPILYTRTLGEGTDEGFAAPVEVRPVPVKLTDAERKEYARLTDMIRLAGSPPQAYTRLVGHDPETGEKLFGGQVMTQRKILVAMAENKLDALVEIVEELLGLSEDCNCDAPAPPRRLFVWSEFIDSLDLAKGVLNSLHGPIAELVTGKTPKAERKRLLTEAWGRDFPVLLIARIGEEGLDYPEVAHGIIIAGAKTSRQNMQRIGRLLRPMPGKTAKLWLIFTEGTMEEKLLNVIDQVIDE